MREREERRKPVGVMGGWREVKGSRGSKGGESVEERGE